MKNYKTSTKFLVCLIPILAFAFMSFGIYTFDLIKHENILANKEITEKIGIETIKALRAWISDQIRIGKTIAADPRIILACRYPTNVKTRDIAEQFLREMHKRFQYNENIPIAIKLPEGKSFVRRVNGTDITIRNGNFFVDTVEGRTIGKCSTQLSYIPPTFSGEDHFISEVYPSILRGNPIFAIAIPVWYQNVVLGALILAPRMDYFTDMFVENVKIGTSGYVLMLDERGLLISHPQKDMILKKEDGGVVKPLEVVKPLKQIQTLLAKIKNGETYFQESYEGVEKYYTVEQINDKNLKALHKWYVVCARDCRDIFDQAYTFIRQTIVFIIFIGILMYLSVYLLTRVIIAKPLERLKSIAESLNVGDMSIKVDIDRNDEIGKVLLAFNRMIDNTQEIVHQAQSIAKGEYTVSIIPRSEKDDLTHALIKMTKSLNDFHNQNNEQNWLKSGLADLSTCMRGELEIETLANNILKFLAKYVHSLVGVLYLKQQGQDNLLLIASYANKISDKKVCIKIGQTLVGQVALEQKSLILKDIPSDYTTISSGIGQTLPRHLIIIPLIRDEILVGVLELGSYSDFSETEIRLVNQAAESIAIAVDSAGSRSRLKELLQETQRQAEELKQASKYKSEFLANMSHELRTPMNGVLGMAEILLDTELTNEQKDFVQTIINSANALLILLNDILDFSKIEAGRLELEIIPFDFETLVEEIGQLLSMKAGDKGLDLIVRYKPDIPRYYYGDPTRIRQVIMNLIGNAIKFTENGHVLLDVEGKPVDNQTFDLSVKIQDTGIGIPEAAISKLFGQFSQVDASTTRKYGGTGLGLAICKQLIEMMGGTIGVQSKEGEGSTFYFNISLKQAPEEEKLIYEKFDISGLRTLIVDDNQINRKVLKERLEKWRIPCDEASSGDEALRIMQKAVDNKEPFKIAILDHQMPVMDGEKLGKLIMNNPRLRETILIMLTSMGDRSNAKQFQEIGFAAYMSKPLRSSQLFDTLVNAWSLYKIGKSPKETLEEQKTKVSDKKDFKINAKVLLVEDNLVNQKVAVQVLKKFGCDVEVANNGLEGFEAVKKNKYDVVFIDGSMPVMDGYEATGKIREFEGDTRHIPIVAMTAHAMKGDREKCIAAGMDEYVTKPIVWDSVRAILIKYCSEKVCTENQGSNDQAPKKSETTKINPKQTIHKKSFKSPLLNREYLLHIAEIGKQFYQDILRDTYAHIEKTISKVSDAIESHDNQCVGFEAHSIKGVAGNIGAMQLVEVASDIERVANNGGDLESCKALLQDLVKSYEEVTCEISKIDVDELIQSGFDDVTTL